MTREERAAYWGPKEWWKKAAPEPNTGCHLWTGSTSSSGYGGGGDSSAHRLAWIRAHGPIPAGMHVCHRCDVKLCVNPDHLFLGTRSDNMRDAIRKGRKGKLSIEAIRDIRAARAAGETLAVLAARHNVSKAAISLIARGDRLAWLKT